MAPMQLQLCLEFLWLTCSVPRHGSIHRYRLSLHQAVPKEQLLRHVQVVPRWHLV